MGSNLFSGTGAEGTWELKELKELRESGSLGSEGIWDLGSEGVWDLRGETDDGKLAGVC